jgi:hypothetical protein
MSVALLTDPTLSHLYGNKLTSPTFGSDGAGNTQNADIQFAGTGVNLTFAAVTYYRGLTTVKLIATVAATRIAATLTVPRISVFADNAQVFDRRCSTVADGGGVPFANLTAVSVANERQITVNWTADGTHARTLALEVSFSNN